ncbi:MAG: ABC transporter ATP-binding protein [bacterium]
MSNVIEIKNFSKNYDSVKAVDNLNLSIEKGKIVGFVGKNGAGKSTLIRSIMNFIKPTSGKIKIFGMDSQLNSKEIKNRCAYVPSESIFYDGLSGKELLEFSIKFSSATWEEVEKLSNYFEFDLNKKIEDLSFGNKKKLSLIQAFLKKAELLIFDEPTNGLDPLMQKKFFKLLLDEKNSGKTIFLSSHNLVDVEEYCDSVAILKNGILVDYVQMDEVSICNKYQVTYKEKYGELISFEYEDEINDLMKKLNKLNLEYIEIKQKKVSDHFISYYKEEEL